MANISPFSSAGRPGGPRGPAPPGELLLLLFRMTLLGVMTETRTDNLRDRIRKDNTNYSSHRDHEQYSHVNERSHVILQVIFMEIHACRTKSSRTVTIQISRAANGTLQYKRKSRCIFRVPTNMYLKTYHSHKLAYDGT